MHLDRSVRHTSTLAAGCEEALQAGWSPTVSPTGPTEGRETPRRDLDSGDEPLAGWTAARGISSLPLARDARHCSSMTSTMTNDGNGAFGRAASMRRSTVDLEPTTSRLGVMQNLDSSSQYKTQLEGAAHLHGRGEVRGPPVQVYQAGNAREVIEAWDSDRAGEGCLPS
ncbi:hypothetical protein SCP_0500110 [Sparassis crispa]|uniref:Uncharacterized protein n=1 Tax=Sparassis crispa TaxID=139825 RepID=A0A401GLC1_9APHY|nr:hypothetical protein SCP_0500110 [Sparassis crispa]GBE82968.1 hypothetical protein SCP_0500110 [Sparassis crispa]